MARKWKAAVIGTGVVGEWHVRLLPQFSNCEMVAVCDIVPERAKAILDKYKIVGVPVFADYKEMIRKHPDVDNIHVCMPSGAHLEPVLTAFENKKNVICEKPLEIQLDRIDTMIAAAKAHGVRLAGIFQNRWNEANKAIKQAVDEGRFGRIAWAGCFTPWYRPDKYYDEGGWRGTWELDGGGAIMNQSVHAIDLLQWIAGPVKSIAGFTEIRIHPQIKTEDLGSATLRFQNGALGTIMGTTAMFPGMAPRLEIGGENGTAISEDGLRMFKFRDARPEDAEQVTRLQPTSTSGGASNRDVKLKHHQENITHILQRWEEGRDADTCGPEARKAVSIVLAMYASARNGGSAVEVSNS